MVSSVIQALSNEELQALVKALDTIQQYFSEKIYGRKGGLTFYVDPHHHR